jgi:hypothetical protein
LQLTSSTASSAGTTGNNRSSTRRVSPDVSIAQMITALHAIAPVSRLNRTDGRIHRFAAQPSAP